MQIEPAHAPDIDDIEQLLRLYNLPLDGLRDAAVDLIVARDDGRIVGSAGLEWHGPNALLRSVAVAPGRRGQGLGAAMTRTAIDRAAAKGATEIVLLTTTAAPFFSRLGFETITRHEVAAELQRSVEFTTACPASATVMRKRLGPAG